MASVTPKIRSRKDGAAVPLDELDKRLLNLMQGAFPLEPRPVRRGRDGARRRRGRGAARASPSSSSSGSSARSRRSSTRARSATSRCSSPRRSTPSTRGARRRSSTRTPASRTTTCATTSSTCGSRSPIEPDSALGLQGTLDVLQRPDRRRVDPPAADAQAVQDPHGPRDGGRHRGAGPVGRGRRARRDRAPALRRARPRRHPRHAGRPAGRLRALRRRPPASSGMPVRAARRAPRGHARAPAAAPRRRDPLPPPRRLQRQRHGRLAACPRTRSSRSARGWPPSAASPTATSARPTRDWPYQIFTMAHGRSKEECDAILDASIAEVGGIERARDAVLVDRVQEGPAALLHRRLQALGARARGHAS